jgi:hypothetical protein
MIGSAFCKEWVPTDLLDRETGIEFDPVVDTERLWEVFCGINDTWALVRRPRGDGSAADASVLRSSWREFVSLRIQQTPSYAGEYANALRVLDDLASIYGDDALEKLLFESGLAYDKSGRMAGVGEKTHPNTRLGHAKHYVIDEFISVLVVAGGFRSIAGWNYKGFLGGSRFNRAARMVLPITRGAGT